MYYTVRKIRQENVTHIFKKDVLNRNQFKDGLHVGQNRDHNTKNERERETFSCSKFMSIFPYVTL